METKYQLLLRYLCKVEKRGDDECWPWMASKGEAGYGMFGVQGADGKWRTKYAHRVGYEIHIGPIPEGQIVRHTCDNPPCNNPAHWLLGTHMDNAKDRKAHGAPYVCKGMDNNNARLNDDQVLHMIEHLFPLVRSGILTQTGIAKMYGVSGARINQIMKGKGWLHLQPKTDDENFQEAELDHTAMVARGSGGVWAAPYQADPF